MASAAKRYEGARARADTESHVPSQGAQLPPFPLFPFLPLPLFFLMLVFTGHPGCSSSVTDAELARRVAAAHPAWQSYEEDIKAQMGARPAAEWSGSLISVECDAESIRAAFRIAGPWASRAAALPILMREPTGRVFQNRDARHEADVQTYIFERPAELRSQTPAWLEFRFPHEERRVIMSEQGNWRAEQE